MWIFFPWMLFNIPKESAVWVNVTYTIELPIAPQMGPLVSCSTSISSTQRQFINHKIVGSLSSFQNSFELSQCWRKKKKDKQKWSARVNPMLLGWSWRHQHKRSFNLMNIHMERDARTRRLVDIHIFLALSTKRAQKQWYSKSNKLNLNAQGLVSKYHSPIKEIRIPWRNARWA